jgi:hypothetical protein
MVLLGPIAEQVEAGKLRIWMDIDVNDSRAAYQRAVDFVAARNLAYNLSSNRLEASNRLAHVASTRRLRFDDAAGSCCKLIARIGSPACASSCR